MKYVVKRVYNLKKLCKDETHWFIYTQFATKANIFKSVPISQSINIKPGGLAYIQCVKYLFGLK